MGPGDRHATLSRKFKNRLTCARRFRQLPAQVAHFFRPIQLQEGARKERKHFHALDAVQPILPQQRLQTIHRRLAHPLLK
jgi:hypothetical protein